MPRLLSSVAALITVAVLAGVVLGSVGAVLQLSLSSERQDDFSTHERAANRPEPSLQLEGSVSDFDWRASEKMLARFVGDEQVIVNLPNSSAQARARKAEITITLHAIAEQSGHTKALLTVNKKMQWLGMGDPVGDSYQILEITPTNIITDIPGAEFLGLFGTKDTRD